jgi:hypothetical protein
MGAVMRQVVCKNDVFECPCCGAQYVLDVEDSTPIIGVLGGQICVHLEREVLPTPSGAWEVYFEEPERD